MSAPRASLVFVVLSITALAASRAAAARPEPIPGEKLPLLRLEPEGPTTRVSALAFAPRGQTLYAAGFDKVVRVYAWDGRHFIARNVTYRVPIGPGLAGVLNALAVSPDGTWLAVGGLGVVRDDPGFRQPGLWLPTPGTLSPELRQDQGTIYVFNTRDQTMKRLRGHRGPVLAVAFAPTAGKPTLVSFAREGDGKATGVFRLWDVEEETQKHEIGGVPDPGARADLAVWLGGEPDAVYAAVAVGDGAFRVWDVAAGKVVEAADGKFNSPAAALPGGNSAWSGSVREADGLLQEWHVQGGRVVPTGRTVRFPAVTSEKLYFYPRAVTLFRSQGRDYAAVAVLASAPGDVSIRLRVIDLASLEIVKMMRLWDGVHGDPVLAASPDGRHLAVTGGPGHEIRLYPVRQLLEEEKPPEPQRIRSAGAPIGAVAFVRSGEAQGLLLRNRPKARAGIAIENPEASDLIFDVGSRRLLADTGGWRVERAANPDRWGAALVTVKGRQGLEVTRGGRAVKTVWLAEGQQVTDYALLPPLPPLNTPLLAVAFEDRFRQPLLALHNAASGEQLRQLTAHVGAVRGLSFSSDGRLLASAGDDQTVCVWWLADLAQLVGRQGFLNGVAVTERAAAGGSQLVVARVEDNSPAHGKLAEGDVIEGVVEGGQVKAYDTSAGFYVSLLGRKPGDLLTLRVRGNKGDVTIRLGQAVEERKPLFSFFVTEGVRPEDRDWIGWSPTGPYDASGRRAERFLGWHTGTEDPKRPVSFVRADRYRAEFEHTGVLKRLMETGAPGKPKDKPPPKPEMSLWIDGPGATRAETDTRGHFLIRHREAALRVLVEGCEPDEVGSVRWEGLGGATGELRRAGDGGRFWSADLAPALERLKWKRDSYPVRVVLRTREEVPRDYFRELTLRVVPAAPVLQLQQPRRLPVEGADAVAEYATAEVTLPLKWRVAPAVAGERVRVRLTHLDKDGKPVPTAAGTDWDVNKDDTLTASLTLQAGTNRIELVAENRDGTGPEAPSAELERRRLVLHVTFTPKAPLQVVVRSVLPLVGELRPRPLDQNRSVVVQVPKLRLVGAVTAAAPLTRVEWAQVVNGKPKAFRTPDGFKANARPTEFVLNETLRDLDPGTHRFLFRAASAAGETAEFPVTITYRPPPPTVALTAPPVIYEGRHEGDLVVEGQVIRPADDPRPHPFRAVLIVNGQELKDRIEVNGEKLTARVPVEPGQTYTILARLTNEWGGVAPDPDPITVKYVRPPRLMFDRPPDARKPFVDLVARVRSATPLVVGSLAAEVQGPGEETPRELALEKPEVGPDGQTWTLYLRNVPLRQGRNRVTLRLRNTESPEPVAESVVVVYTKPLDPPMIEILEPRQDVVATREARLRFRVKAPGPLQRLAVVRGQEVVKELAPPKGPGPVDIEQTVTVPLKSGRNPLAVVAAGEGGEARRDIPLSRVARRVWLDVESLQVRGAGAALEPKARADGVIVFPRVPSNQVTLRGRVTWDDPDDPQLARSDLRVGFQVNAFRQPPAALRRRSPDEPVMTFEAPLVLNRSSDNRILVRLPQELKQDDGGWPEVVIQGCDKPQTEQWMHLLIVAAGPHNPDEVEEKVLKVLGVVTHEGRRQTDLFQRVEVWGPLTHRRVTRDFINTALHNIRVALQNRAAAGFTHDVVLIYYDGGESRRPDGHFLQAADGKEPIDCGRLAESFAASWGAHVLLFDVARSEPFAAGARDKLAEWSRDPHVDFAAMRMAWEGDEPRRAHVLLTALETALPRASTLRELASNLAETVARLPEEQRKRLAYQPVVPPPVADLTLRKER